MKMAHRTSLGLGLLFCGVMVHAAEAGQGPLGTYYLTGNLNQNDGVSLDAIRGDSLVQNATYSGSEGPIAVSRTVRTTSTTIGTTGGSNYGGEYEGVDGLTLTKNGTTYINNLIDSTDNIFDGTTDSSHNFTVGFFSGNLYQTDTSWGGTVSVLFSTGNVGDLGITYDRLGHSFWVQNFYSGLITNYSATGQVLSSFQPTRNGYQFTALAMDIDHTLWFEEYGGGIIEHYTLDGQWLGYATYADAGLRFDLGGEIASVPEPSTLIAGVVGVLGLVGLRRRRHCP